MAEKDIVVLYHGESCLDGFGAATVAYLKYGDSAEYLPMSYINPWTVSDAQKMTGKSVLILDFGFDKEVMLALLACAKYVLWLDHSQDFLEGWCGEYRPESGSRIPMAVGGGRQLRHRA